uniref:Pinin/SDK/MemA protein domain-containing protein n=1 Tax=Lotharella globosa TaxID=91324 RepID=A0A6U3EPN8_9EUKA|mmetsp:Transcript_7952/g.15337  ORF Transcript_7952/g.15337 Transcript_7952/m.15337 type:complete len:185 (+) Transcript_7952:663-1217(+)
MEEKVEERMVEVRMEVRDYARKRAEKKREKELKMREDILKKQREKHQLLLQLRLADHEKTLANFIRTKHGPSIYWTPAKHNEATESLLEKMKDESEKKIDSGLVVGFGEEEDDIPAWRNRADPRDEEINGEDKDKKDDDDSRTKNDGDGDEDNGGEKDEDDVDKKVDDEEDSKDKDEDKDEDED